MPSLRNKTDELQAHVHFSHEFRDACILAVTETWLAEKDRDSELVIDGFSAPLLTDRDAQTTGKTRGGGVCFYINDRWCKTVLVSESLCTKDMELLTVFASSLPAPRVPAGIRHRGLHSP